MRAWLFALCLGAFACHDAGTVIVLGDSNSCMWWETGCVHIGDTYDWPDRMTKRPDWPGWDVINRALPNMVAGDYDGKLYNGDPLSGAWHLEQIIRENLADACLPLIHWTPRRRKLVIALGTNDLARPQVPGTGAGLAIVALYERARQVPCVDAYVATIPPRANTDPAKIALANALVQTRVPADHVIPFGAQAPSDLDATGAHMTDEGQKHRAELAFAVLFH